MVENRKFRFLVASDGHYGEPGVSYRSNYLNFTDWVKKEKEQKGLDLFVFNGDLVHDRPDYLEEVKSYFDSTGVDYLVVRGNHDTISEQKWTNLFGQEIDFTYHIGPIAFLSCRTSDDQGKYLCADRNWLANEFKKNSAYRFLFLFLHISQGGWTEHGIHCQEVIDLLDNHPQITAVFHGHDHQEFHLRRSLNTVYFFDGYIGASWGGDTIGYRIVEMDDDRILTYQKDPITQTILNRDLI